MDRAELEYQARALGLRVTGAVSGKTSLVVAADPQKVQPHLPMHGLRDSFGTWVYETYGVKQAQEWLGHGDPATTLRHYVRLTTAARAKAVAGLDEVTRAALEAALMPSSDPETPHNVIELASRRG
jgi:integrase